MRWLVTRPAAQADEWVEALRAQGLDAQALPLIGIAPAPDPAPVAAAWKTLDQEALVVFVSPNAAEQFFALRPGALPWPGGVRAASPGPGTTRTLQRLGVPAGAIVEPAADAAQFDSEALWAQLRRFDWRGASVLIVRGDGGRDWLAETLRAAGARVRPLCAYRRGAPQLDDRQRALLEAALVAPAAHGWLFSSSEAIDQFVALAPDADHAAARALATHPRIAARARAAGFGTVLECRPSQAAVVACIQSIEP
ncbi:MAG: uroporphyrinogen-III synthase [Piscinibacter sp.]|nr:uroporphyrinogen-III synthase [Piscinibacter sp.]